LLTITLRWLWRQRWRSATFGRRACILTGGAMSPVLLVLLVQGCGRELRAHAGRQSGGTLRDRGSSSGGSRVWGGTSNRLQQPTRDSLRGRQARAAACPAARTRAV